MKIKGINLPNKTKNMLVGYIFLLPVIVGLIYLFIPAMVQSFTFSLNEVKNNPTGGLVMSFTGLANYNRGWNIDVTFKQTLIKILVSLAANVPIILIFSFLIANILNQKFKLRGFARALFFIPVIISTGIISKIESTDMITGIYGAASNFSSTVNAGGMLDVGKLINFYVSLGIGGEIGTAILKYVVTAIDKLYFVLVSSGVQILIYLSALQSVPVSLYEASHVEGCSKWEAFWKITLPIVSPMLLVNTIYTIVDSFLDPRSELTKLISSTTFISGDYGYGAAMTWMYFLSAGCILAAIYFIISRLMFYYDE